MLISKRTAFMEMAEIALRPRIFLDIQSGSDFFGRIVVELFNDKAPRTCEK